jgi:type IV secretion system protein VirB6
MAASQFHFYEKLFSKLNASLTNYVGDTAASVIGGITPVVTTRLALYVVFWGLSIMRGAINEPITDGAGRIVRLAVITGIALEGGRYNTYISSWLFNSPDAMAAYVAGGGFAPTSNIQFLDSLMSNMYDFGLAYSDKASANSIMGIPDLPMLVMAYGIWAAGILLTGYGAFLLVIAKITLAITLAIGPIFIILTIFEATKKFFDSWLGQVLNAVFQTILTAASIKLILTLVQAYLSDASGVVAADPSLNQALPAVAYAIIGVLVLLQVPSIAGALGGGVSVSTLGAVSWAAGKTGRGAKAMRPTNLKKAYNGARADVSLAKKGAKATAGMPMAVYRKVTGGSKNRVSKA